MSYFKKGHVHKPKKGKGSYERGSMSKEDNDNVVDINSNKKDKEKFFTEEDYKNWEDMNKHSERYPWHEDKDS